MENEEDLSEPLLNGRIREIEEVFEDATKEGVNDVEGKDTKSVKGKSFCFPFLKLFTFADSIDVTLMIVGTISAIVSGMSFPLTAILYGQLIDSFGTSDQSGVVNAVTQVAFRYVYFGIGAALISFLHISCFMITGERQAARIRSLYLSNILMQGIAFFDKELKTGEVMERLSGDTVLIQKAMGEKAGKFIQYISTFLGGFVIAFMEGWLQTIVTLPSIPLMFAAMSFTSLLVSKFAKNAHLAYAHAGNTVEQTIGSIRTVVSFTGENEAVEKYSMSLTTAYLASVKQDIANGLGLGLIFLILFCTFGTSLWYGSKLIIDKGYNGGQVMVVMNSIINGGMALGNSVPCINAFATANGVALKFFEIIERKLKIDADDTNGIILDDLKGDIELNDVHFSYPTRPDVAIFSGFSLHVPHGITLALVGESGSGKSTVFSLIERFYDPQACEVLIDGVNLKKLQLGWLRERIGLVSQESILFATSIKENIAYGKVGATLKEIQMAADLANASTFINKMPQGINTLVGEHGTQLSGGQKQRIAIARVIIKNPQILLLDEATSALDAESEHIIKSSLLQIRVGTTTIVVAHRLSTVKDSDLIAVVQQGKIVEKGSHSELTNNPEGHYSKLIRLQELNVVEMVEPHDNIAIEADSFPDAIIGIISDSTGTVLNAVAENMQEEASGDASSSRKLSRTVTPMFIRLVYLNMPELPIIMLGCIVAAVQGVFFPILGLFLANLIHTFYEPQNRLRRDANFWSLMCVLLGILNLVVTPTHFYLFGVTGAKLIKRIRVMAFKSVMYQEIGWFDDNANSSGAIGARLSADAAILRRLSGDTLDFLVQNIAAVVVGVTIAFSSNWRLALAVLGFLPLIAIQDIVHLKFMEGFSADAKVMYEQASQVAHDAVSNIRTVASFCLQHQVLNLHKRKCDIPKRAGIRRGVVGGIMFGSTFFVIFCSEALCFYVGSHFVQAGTATFKQVFMVFLALTMTSNSICQASASMTDMGDAKSALMSIFAILDRKPKIDANSDEGLIIPHVKGEIEFQHVTFTYPARPDIQILRGLCLTVYSGKTVALVGESGCGKSTIVSLLERFYDPDSGEILLDGIEIRKLQLKWLRHQIGLVSQEPILLNQSIRANIAYGKPGAVATEEEIIAATKAANAHGFISALPQGYDTLAGERGVQLSGGQKQRIAIARAMIKDPKILLLDEATSALDAQSEQIVQEALDKAMLNRSTIQIAHRLSTIQNADVIAVLKDGVIVEKGKHETLIGIKGGIYASHLSIHNK